MNKEALNRLADIMIAEISLRKYVEREVRFRIPVQQLPETGTK